MKDVLIKYAHTHTIYTLLIAYTHTQLRTCILADTLINVQLCMCRY